MHRIPAVHFGPGRLGLGLIVDVLLDTGRFDVYLIGAPGREQRELATYFLRFTNPALGLRERRVAWAGNPEDDTDLPDALVRELHEDRPILFTSALGAVNVAEARPRIARMLSLRPVTAATALLACENEPHEIYNELQRDFPHVDVRRCVVDRICAWDTKPSLDPGRRILAHDVSQWVIPHATNPALEGLRNVNDVLLLDGDAAAYRDRKRWVVNGIHLVLATIARREGIDLLPLIGKRELAFREHSKPLAMAMLDTVERMHGLPVDEQFADERVRGFCEAPDSATRILSGRYLRHDLRPFVQRLDSRVSTAARAAQEHGVDVEPFLWAFSEIVLAATYSDSFLDVSEVDPDTGKLRRCDQLPEIDAEIDREVEVSFATALDWAPQPDAMLLQRRVNSALAIWRND